MYSFVIPCYNESKRFFRLENAIKAYDTYTDKPVQVILVNDGSSDNTLDLMKQFARNVFKNTTVRVVDLKNNLGKGGALRAGVLAAKGDFILTLDADMSSDPKNLYDWKEHLGIHEFDQNTIYIANRAHKDSRIEVLKNRKSLGGLFNNYIQWITPLQEEDTQCGFKLYPKQIAFDLFTKLLNFGWAHDIELLYRAHLEGINICSLPIKWKHVGDAKINVFKDGLKMVIAALAIKRRLNNEYKGKK